MKNQLIFSLAALLVSATVFGQAESDDMYFNSKDRAKLKAQTASEASSYVVASAKKPKKVEQAAAEEVVNPTDSYSARNVNPEYAARSSSQTAAADNPDYFVNNYQYKTSTNLNNWNSNYNNNYNNWAGTPWYAPSYYGYSINEWGSPYYGYGMGGNPWCGPYYGWTTGIGLSYSAYSNPYMNSWYGYPYAAYGYGYGGGYGYGYGGGYGYYGYGGGGYPGTVVIINNGGDNGRNVVYGKRASHGGMVTTPQSASYTRPRNNYPTAVTPDAVGGRVSTSGRTATTQRQEDYYNRSWRGSQQTSSYQQGQNRSSSYDPWSGNSNRDSYNRDTNSSFSPSNNSSRSSSSFDSGGSRQAAPASSGSNGRSRGRD